MKIANLPNKIALFLKEVRLEMKKVNWPTRNETVKYTLVVVGFCLVVAAFLGSLDALFQFLLNKLVNK